MMQRRAILGAGLAVAGGVAMQGQESRKRATSVITKDGFELYYRDWGAGSPVVFVHGWSMNSDMWQYQMVHLAGAGVRCIAYDQRGHGRSAAPGSGYDPDTMAGDLAAVMEQLDLRGVTLVGHSMGCAEMARYLMRYGGGRVARVAMIAPSLPFLLKTADNPEGVGGSYFEALRSGWRRDFPKWLDENARPFVVKETSTGMVQWLIGLSRQCSLQAAIECNRTFAETDFRPDLAKITAPTVVIHGDADVSAPLEACGRRTARLISGSTLKVYEGAPHGLFVTHMERVNQDLAAFVKS